MVPFVLILNAVYFCVMSATGRFVYRKGALVPTSLDLYLALEYCDQGECEGCGAGLAAVLRPG
jgi:hypothetical protein